MNAILTDNLSKTYPDGKTAVDSVSIQLSPGEIFGFLGPNGAGKTTTVKLLNGMLSPTKGSLQVFGVDPSGEPEKIHALSGVVTERAQMYDHLTGLENLLFYGTLFGLSRDVCQKRGLTLLDRLELSDARDKKLSAYSTGMRQKLSLARALLHDPKILFLDEPTSGLDPKSAQTVHSLIQSLARERGTTVFLCTHQLRYAQEICTCYGLIDKGRLFAKGTLDQLRSRLRFQRKIRLEARNLPPSYDSFRLSREIYEIPASSTEKIPSLVRQIVNDGGEVYGVEASLPSLEDIYFSLTEKSEVKKR